MFFIGVFGIDGGISQINGKLASICPACNKSVFLSVCKKYNYFHAFFIPVFKYKKQYICTCPSCASVMVLDEPKGKLLEQTGNCVAGTSDLILLKNNWAGKCPSCGARNNTDANFCQNCGKSF